ncbi:MAG: gliding motility-associated C-terminal domain-containing protein, partial [Bacteroidales bacterium]|nr:gliding motility-associated C-terminal domain-containing protein [Bacteroidales bacterium]
NVFVHDSPTACLRIPNVFSPNDDGINDTWEIDNIWLYEDAKILVYNRWGQNLYKGDSTSEPWDGTYKGKKLPAGPYVYVVSLGNDKKTYKGSVNIIY